MNKRPDDYYYFERMKFHLGGNLDCVFNGKLVYPRQLEVHLPGDGKERCNFRCAWCQGSQLEQPLGDWEETGLRLLDKLEGRIPYHIYGGAYTEPMMNPYIMDYLRMTKKHGAYFGIHTNGSQLLKLEKEHGALQEMCHIATPKWKPGFIYPNDYLSISLDAGFPESHMKAKGLKENWFDRIIEGIRLLAKFRGDRDFPAIRIVYLLNKWNSSPEEIENIVRLGEEIGVDSIRFSIPYDVYGKDFEEVRRYKQNVELRNEQPFYKIISLYIQDKKPIIFWTSPDQQDVDRMSYRQCIYSYFQITLAADGWVYRCSSTASPSFKFCRLGEITDDLGAFNRLVVANHNPRWKPETCFRAGARCNRQALSINTEWEKMYV